MHEVVIQAAKSSKSLGYWCCGCSFRNRTEQEPSFTCLCASEPVTQQILAVVGDQLVSKAKWLQARDSHWKSQDFHSWISNSPSPSVWLEALKTWTQHPAEMEVYKILHCCSCCTFQSSAIFCLSIVSKQMSPELFGALQWGFHVAIWTQQRNKQPKNESFCQMNSLLLHRVCGNSDCNMCKSVQKDSCSASTLLLC